MPVKRARLSGQNPLSYLGVEQVSSPELVTYTRAPTSKDRKGHMVGDFWLDTSTEDVWILMSLAAGIGTWVKFGFGTDLFKQFNADVGSAAPASFILNVLGFQSFNTAAIGDILQLRLDQGTDGQVLIGGGAAASFGNITSTGVTLAITNGPNTINIEAIPGGDLAQLGTDAGTVNPSGGIVVISGATNVDTIGAADNLTVNLDNSISLSGGLTLSLLTAGVIQTSVAGLVSSSNGANGEVLIGGGATPAWDNITSTGATITVTNAANSIELEIIAAATLQQLGSNSGTASSGTGTANVLGGTNINTSGAAATETVNLDNSISIPGTLTLSGSTAGVVQTSAAGVVSSSNGANGEVLIGGGATPLWDTITSTGGTISIINSANSIQIDIGTTTLQQLVADSGFASSGTGTVNVVGGTNINTSGAASTETINLDNSIDLASTLTLSGSTAGVVQTSAVGVVSSSNGANGEVLIGGGAAPVWANITSTTLNITNGANTINIETGGGGGAMPPFLYCQIGDGGSAYLGGAGYYYLGDSVALTKIFDDDNNLYPGDGAGAHAVFTAPVTGKYLLNMVVSFTATSVGTISPEMWMEIVTTARTYHHGLDAIVPNASLVYSRRFSAVCDMTATDTAHFRVMANTGATVNVDGSADALEIITWVSGFLVEV